MNLGQEHPVLENGLLTSICCDQLGRSAYALEGAIFTAGAAVQWLRDGLRIITDAADSELLAKQVPHTDGVYFVPAFTGLGVPYWDMNARGALVGLTGGTNRSHIARAALESLAYQTLDVVEAMRRSEVELTELRSDGGAAANDFLMQFQADVLGVPIDRPKILETTASGAAFLAGLGIGFWKNPQSLRSLRRRERLFKPNMTNERRNHLYNGWRKAVHQVLTPSP
jgi:glycerol kinase